MAARQIVVPGAMPARDANGRALPSKFRFYAPGTTIPATVYSDQALTIPHPFPLPSDSAGRWPEIWADDANSFSVGWTDQIYDQTIEVFTGIRGADDAVLASVDMAQGAADQAVAAALMAQAIASELSGEPFTATSDSPLTVSTGLKSFTLDQLGKLFTPGQTVVIARAPPNAGTQMTGIVMTANDETGAMTVQAATAMGSGAFSDWQISLSSSGGVLSVAGLTGIISTQQLNDVIDDEIVALAIAL